MSLRDAKTRDRTAALSPVVTAAVVNDMAALADEVHVDDAILDYLSRIAEETRRHEHPARSVGAWLPGLHPVREDVGDQPGPNHVIPDDIKLLAQPVLNHRLLCHHPEAQSAGITVDQVIGQILGEVSPPTERVA